MRRISVAGMAGMRARFRSSGRSRRKLRKRIRPRRIGAACVASIVSCPRRCRYGHRRDMNRCVPLPGISSARSPARRSWRAGNPDGCARAVGRSVIPCSPRRCWRSPYGRSSSSAGRLCIPPGSRETWRRRATSREWRGRSRRCAVWPTCFRQTSSWTHGGLLRRYAADIAAHLDVARGVAVPAGHFALGVSYDSLHDHDRSRFHLQEAWDRKLRSPEVALALGRTLSHLYRREMETVRWIPNHEDRIRRTRAAEDELRVPSAEYLRLGRESDAASARLVDAEIAFLEGRLDEAIHGAEVVLGTSPWHYEAGLVRANALLEQAETLDASATFDNEAARGRDGQAGLSRRAGDRAELSRGDSRRV